MWIGIAAVVLGGLVVAEVGRRARSGRLSRNPLVGIRTRDTLGDDETWDRVHSAAGSWLIAAGVVATVCAIVAGACALAGAGEGVVAALLIAATVGMVVLIVVGALLADRAGPRR